MKKMLQWISNTYKWVTSRVPLELLHFTICFCTTLFSLEMAIGLAIGRESGAFTSVDRMKDSLKDLLADILGILLAVGLKFIL